MPKIHCIRSLDMNDITYDSRFHGSGQEGWRGIPYFSRIRVPLQFRVWLCQFLPSADLDIYRPGASLWSRGHMQRAKLNTFSQPESYWLEQCHLKTSRCQKIWLAAARQTPGSPAGTKLSSSMPGEEGNTPLLSYEGRASLSSLRGIGNDVRFPSSHRRRATRHRSVCTSI